ncbi:MAG: hypothetical protein ACJ73N_14195 [Bryobacteraceae bacterium]
MEYSPEWDLSTVPLDKLKSEWARRNALLPRESQCGHKPEQPDVCQLCYDRKRQRDYRRMRREKGLDK